MRPWLVFAIQPTLMGPVIALPVVQVAPPSSDDTKPTVSSHVLVVQLLTGK